MKIINELLFDRAYLTKKERNIRMRLRISFILIVSIISFVAAIKGFVATKNSEDINIERYKIISIHEGETLEQIARREKPSKFYSTLRFQYEIVEANKGTDSIDEKNINLIHSGDKLYIPIK